MWTKEHQDRRFMTLQFPVPRSCSPLMQYETVMCVTHVSEDKAVSDL